MHGTRGHVGIALAVLTCMACAAPRSPRAGDVESARAMRADSLARTRADSVNRAQPGYVVDSFLAPEEELRRFMAGVPAPPSTFSSGATSRDRLVEAWRHALEVNDSVSLIRLAVNRPEFGALVYPSSPYTRPPYQQPPWLAWMQLSNGSVQGFRRTLTRLGARPLGYAGYSCGPASRQGRLRLWTDCRVRRVVAEGDTVTQRLFGPIVALGGSFKFLSLASDF